MKIQELRVIAKEKGVQTARKSKAEIIGNIQDAEGNFRCFGTATMGVCDQSGCAWREECLPAPAKSSKSGNGGKR